MRIREAFLAGIGAAALLFCCGQARAQNSSDAKAPVSTMTIAVTSMRPIEAAMDVIEKRYGVPIDYSDPIYASDEDTQFYYSLHGKNLTTPLLGPRTRTISIQYEEVKEPPKGISYLSCKVQTYGCTPAFAWPVDGITALIQRVLKNLAAQGGQVFTVRKVQMTQGPWYDVGPRWEVYPIKVRNASGTFVKQPDFLSAVLHIAPARRTVNQMLDLIAQQLTRKWGLKFKSLGCCAFTEGVPSAQGTNELGSELSADGTTARQAILALLDPRLSLSVHGGTLGDPGFGINIERLPYREPPRPPTPKAIPAHLVPAHPYPPADWVLYIGVGRKGISWIQGALAKAGYLHTAPTTKWDANAIAALRRFQAANGIRSSGKFDMRTAGKLLPYLPEAPAHMVPAKPAMSPALSYWLESTSEGRKEIAEALKKAGFYNGSTNPVDNPEANAALKAFQKANGLRPTGYFDYATAGKLAPFLPKPKN